MKNCSYRLSLDELLSRPAVELRLIGAEGEGVEAGDGPNGPSTNESGSGGSGDGTEESGDDGEDKSKSKKAEPDAKDKKIQSLEEEKQRHYDLRKAAEQELAAANAEIARLKKDGVTDEQTKQELATLRSENSSLKARLSDLALEVAFLKSNKHKWRDATAALKLADLSKVELDDKTGEVHGLDAALDRLAANSAWLLEQDDKANDKDDKKQRTPARRTGDPVSSKDSRDEKTRQAELARYKQKYPGLRR